MIVIAGRLLLLGFAFKPVSWLAGDSRLQQTVTILLLSLYATGNDSCLLRKRIFLILFKSGNVLSLQIVRNWLARVWRMR